MTKAEEREYRVELFDGRGTGTLVVYDGWGHALSHVHFYEGVHEASEVRELFAAEVRGAEAERLARKSESYIAAATTQADREYHQRVADFYWGRA